MPAELTPFAEAIEHAGGDVPVDLDTLLPRDPRKRYDTIQLQKCGSSSPVVLLTYSPGSNVYNLHWLWLSSASDVSSAVL